MRYSLHVAVAVNVCINCSFVHLFQYISQSAEVLRNVFPAGLFLHVGFSSVERRLVETHSTVRFRPETIRVKLASLLRDEVC